MAKEAAAWEVPRGRVQVDAEVLVEPLAREPTEEAVAAPEVDDASGAGLFEKAVELTGEEGGLEGVAYGVARVVEVGRTPSLGPITRQPPARSPTGRRGRPWNRLSTRKAPLERAPLCTTWGLEASRSPTSC